MSQRQHQGQKDNDVSRKTPQYQEITRPWFQTTKWAGGSLQETVRCGLAVVGVGARRRGRDPPPARRFIDMAYLVAGQQAIEHLSASAGNQQPPSSQAPGLAPAPVGYLSGHHKTKLSSCTSVLFVTLLLFHIRTIHSDPLSCIPQLISSSLCCVVCRIL